MKELLLAAAITINVDGVPALTCTVPPTFPALVAAKTLSCATIKPVVTNVSPAIGPLEGGTSVVITGTGFIGVTSVIFGTLPAMPFRVDSATSITATSPAGVPGTVTITVH